MGNQPQRVLALAQRYMEKDATRTSHWFDMAPGFALDCLLIGEGEHRCLYVVTTSPPLDAGIHNRWPLLKSITPSSLSDFPCQQKITIRFRSKNRFMGKFNRLHLR